MGTVLSTILAPTRWHGWQHEMRDFHHLTHNQIIFFVVAGMAILALVVYAIQRRRRRWF